MSNSNRKKNVLIIGGHDPCGGAGIQADIETVTQVGARAVSIVTALTTQNTLELKQVIPQTTQQLDAQLQCLLDDIPVDICKIGLIGNADLIQVIASVIKNINIPLVLDPVLRSGSGAVLANAEIINNIYKFLLPLCTIATPNSEEARQLTQCNKLQDAAHALVSGGANAVLITGTHEQSDKVVNYLYMEDGRSREYIWPRLPHAYHGSGCTLASCIATMLAMQCDLITAIEEAQDYTWQSLKHAEQIGKGQWLPNRYYEKG